MPISISVPLSISLCVARGVWRSMLKKRSEIKLELSEGPFHMRSTEGEQDGEKCVFVCVMGQGRSVCARWINVHKQHNALVWLINKLIDLFKSLLMKDIWTRRWRFYCKIDRVDTTAAASPRCRRRERTRGGPDGDGEEWWSDGGRYDKDREMIGN